jgi:hypothetical protein
MDSLTRIAQLKDVQSSWEFYIFTHPTSILGLLVFLALFIYVAALLSKRKVSFGLGKVKVDVGDEGNSNDETSDKLEKIERHISKVDEKELEDKAIEVMISVVKEYMEMNLAKIHEEEKSILPRQMNYADEKQMEIKTILIDSYAKLLTNKKNKIQIMTDVRNTQEFRTYKMVVELMLKECIVEKTLKKSLRENHLSEKSVENWEIFIHQKADITYGLFKDYLDNHFPEGGMINRPELDTLYSQNEEQVKKLIKAIYRFAREISIEVHTRTKELRDYVPIGIKHITSNYR